MSQAIDTPSPAHATSDGEAEFSPATFEKLTALHDTLANSTSTFALGGTISPELMKVKDVNLFYKGAKTSMGVLNLPISPEDAAHLYELAQPSSHGVGDQTVYDPTYRQAREFKVPDFALSPDPTTEAAILGVLQQKLVRSGGLRAELYKMNIYGEGGFFKPHRDTPRGALHIGTLLFSIPSTHTGGELMIRHDRHEEIFDWSLSSLEDTAFQWAFLYSDCEHEVLPVQSGYRITIQYNIFDVPATVDDSIMQDSRTGLISTLLKDIDQSSPRVLKLAFALQHAYPVEREENNPKNLRLRLKGHDAVLFRVIDKVGLRWAMTEVYAPELYELEETFEWLGRPFSRDLWDKAFRYVAVTCRSFNAMDSGGYFDEDPLYRLIARHGGETTEDVLWMVKPQHYDKECFYTTYGNEAQTESQYTAVAIMVEVGGKGAAARPVIA